MSSSIPIPTRPKSRSTSVSYPDSTVPLGNSLPSLSKTVLHTSSSSSSTTRTSSSSSSSSGNISSNHSTSNHQSRSSKNRKDNHHHHHHHASRSLSSRSRSNQRHQHLSQDDMAAPSIELISRAARRWKSTSGDPFSSSSTSTITGSDPNSASSSSSNVLRRSAFPGIWDFSEVVTATDEVRNAFAEGSAVTKRPPRAGVSGTYFFCKQDEEDDEKHQRALGVFKPMDEEAESIELSPPLPPPPHSPIPIFPPLPFDQLDLSLGPAATITTTGTNVTNVDPSPMSSFLPSPACSPPRFFKPGSVSSDNSDGGESRANMLKLFGFYQGEGAYREVAAYLLDHERFAGVPQTALLQWDKPSYDDDEGYQNDNHNGNVQGEQSDDDDEGAFHHSNEEDIVGSTQATDDSASISEQSDFDDDDDNEDGSVIYDSLGSDAEGEDDNGSELSDDEFEGATNNSNGTTSEAMDVPKSPSSSKRSSRHEKKIQTKKGAFQVYVSNMGDADDFGPGVFDKDQVHRIAILDIRTVNHDRHGGNILVTDARNNNNNNNNDNPSPSSSSKRRYNLVPIDHGYILPDVIQNVPWPVWMDWPCVKQPLSSSIKKYVQYLDAERDVRRLNDELNDVFRPGALQTLKIATTLLQKGVAAGLTLYDIGLLMYTRRDEPYERSELEKIVFEAEEASLSRERHIAEQRLRQAEEGRNDGNLYIESNHHGRDQFTKKQTNNFDDDDNTSLVSPTPSSSPSPSPPPFAHRRHQSISNIGPFIEPFVDEFVVKYASRRIQEIVNRIAAAKTVNVNNVHNNNNTNHHHHHRNTNMNSSRFNNNYNKSNNNNGGGGNASPSTSSVSGMSSPHTQMRRPSFLTRARSIPDFSIGEKPVHAILNDRSRVGTNSHRLHPHHHHHCNTTTHNNNNNNCKTNAHHHTNVTQPVSISLSIPAPAPAPTPASSPPNGLGIGHVGIGRPTLRGMPIQVPINDERVVRISLPSNENNVNNHKKINGHRDFVVINNNDKTKGKVKVQVKTSTSNNNGTTTTTTDVVGVDTTTNDDDGHHGRHHPSSHRSNSNASSSSNLLNMVNNNNNYNNNGGSSGSHMKKTANLPPFAPPPPSSSSSSSNNNGLKNGEKSSPISPLDLYKWRDRHS